MFKKHKNNQKHEKEIDAEVEAIERDSTEALADLYHEDNHHDKKNISSELDNFKPKTKTFWQRIQTASSILVVLLIISAVAGWFFFQRGRTPFTGQGLNLSWQTSENIASGELTTLILSAENKEQVDLQKIVVDITLPADFVVSKTQPELKEGVLLRWRLDELKAGEKVEASIEGAFTGSAEKIVLRAYSTYTPQGLTANFSSQTEKEITILQSDYTVVLSPVATFKIGQKQPLTLEVTSKNVISNSVIQVLLPEAVAVSEINPARDKDTSEERLLQWSVGDLPQNEKKAFKFTVTPSAQTPANSNVVIIIGVKQDQIMKVLSTIIKPFGLNSSALDLKMFPSNNEKILDWGSEVSLQVVLKSLATGTFKDAKVTVNLSGPVRWGGIKGEIKPQDGFGQNMFWTEREFSDLKNITATAIVLPFSVPLENSSQTETALSGKVVFSGTLTTETDKGGYPVVVEYNLPSIPLKAALAFSSKAQYFDENLQPVGAGPLPPVAGQETTYAMVWNISSANSNLNNVEIRAVLPERVNFASALTSAISYDASTRTVTWRLGDLSKGGNNRGEFSINLKPESVDVGKVLGLLGKSKAIGLDEQNQSISQTTEALSTADAVSGKGVVQAQ